MNTTRRYIIKKHPRDNSKKIQEKDIKRTKINDYQLSQPLSSNNKFNALIEKKHEEEKSLLKALIFVVRVKNI